MMLRCYFDVIVKFIVLCQLNTNRAYLIEHVKTIINIEK